ncbi:hypothetical protein Mapa_001281 [Marchantia paleacea]|nr:hypothetical protein Mapa_001281 [Marchantia paleacea]
MDQQNQTQGLKNMCASLITQLSSPLESSSETTSKTTVIEPLFHSSIWIFIVSNCAGEQPPALPRTDLLIAGTETSPHQAQWTMAEFMWNPDVAGKIQAELDFVVGKERIVEETDLPQPAPCDAHARSSSEQQGDRGGRLRHSQRSQRVGEPPDLRSRKVPGLFEGRRYRRQGLQNHSLRIRPQHVSRSGAGLAAAGDVSGSASPYLYFLSPSRQLTWRKCSPSLSPWQSLLNCS